MALRSPYPARFTGSQDRARKSLSDFYSPSTSLADEMPFFARLMLTP